MGLMGGYLAAVDLLVYSVFKNRNINCSRNINLYAFSYSSFEVRAIPVCIYEIMFFRH